MMMIRALSPEVLFVDEIGRPEDAEAVLEALHAGITVVATAHGRDLDDVRRRLPCSRCSQTRCLLALSACAAPGRTGAVVVDMRRRGTADRLPDID